MDCPICGLINPDSAWRCDCGYDFNSRRVERSYLDGPPPDRASPAWLGLRLIAAVWGLLAGGFICLIAGWLWLWWAADSGQRLNPPMLLVATGALQMAGAVLAVFGPRPGGAVMLLAAALTVALLATDIGWQALFLSGADPGPLAMAVLVVAPGILVLLSALVEGVEARSPRGGRRPGRPSGSAGPNMAA